MDLTPPSVTLNADGGGGDRRDVAAGGTGGSPDTEPADSLPAMDAPLLAVGKRCSANDQCAGGMCRDGFCCDGACSGPCHSCALPGMEGSCLPAPAGQDPREECGEDPVASCARDGTCDGNGACRRHPAGSECAGGSCSNGTEYAASTCDGNGVCQPGSSRSCAPNMCTGGSCAATCAQHSDCQNGFFCEAGRCLVREIPGAACSNAVECASGQCVDGVCCRTPCGGSCMSCNVAGSAGTCTAIPDGADPGAECPSEPATSCGRMGGCNGSGGCRLHPAGVVCRAGGCNGLVETAESRCDGQGVCGSGAARSCGAYLCSGAVCATTCSGSGQCRPGNYCAGSSCVAFGAGPVLHWKFDETSGSSALDASGNGHNGSYTGSSGTPAPSAMVPYVSFSNPSSRAFTASSRHAVRLLSAPGAIKPGNNLTISLWFRTSNLDLGHDPPAASEALSLGNNYFVRIRATDVAWTRRSATGYISCFATGTGHLDGRWHHVAAVVSTVGMKVYLDGVERCSNTRGEDLAYDMGPDLWVGRHGTGETEWDFDGNLDDVRIYTRALPAAEVAAVAAGY